MHRHTIPRNYQHTHIIIYIYKFTMSYYFPSALYPSLKEYNSSCSEILAALLYTPSTLAMTCLSVCGCNKPSFLLCVCKGESTSLSTQILGPWQHQMLCSSAVPVCHWVQTAHVNFLETTKGPKEARFLCADNPNTQDAARDCTTFDGTHACLISCVRQPQTCLRECRRLLLHRCSDTLVCDHLLLYHFAQQPTTPVTSAKAVDDHF